MSQTESINHSYFLTRQTANLQEDFDREINISASFFLLYGEAGVGKTRFLNELVSSRFAELNIHWVDCNRSTDDASAVLEPILDSATTGDVIVVDHFEQATNKLKHQLLQSWATDGVDKKFNLIITTGQAGLEEVGNLATRYRLKVKSFQLLPLTPVEMNEYCASLLFPLLPPSPLSMPKQTRRALKETQGVIGNIRSVVEQYGEQMVRTESTDSRSLVKPLLVVCGLACLLVLAGIAYHFMPVTSVPAVTANHQDEAPVVLDQPDDTVANSEPVAEVNETQTVAKAAIGDPVASEAITSETVIPDPVAEPAVAEPAVTESVATEPTVAEKTDTPVAKSEEPSLTQGTEIDPVAAVEPEKELGLIDIVTKAPYSDWFKQELRRSQNWITSSARNRGTIQIMSLRFRGETDDAYQNYVKTVERKGIDVSQLRLYPTRVRGKIRFSVIFGDYSNLQAANQALNSLPASLKARQPISRSMGGILKEIGQQ